MPKFFFDIHDGVHLIQDTEGSDLPDREAAREEALVVLPDVARDKAPDGDHRDYAVNVRDETGSVIFTAALSLAARWLDHLPDDQKVRVETGS